MRKSEFLRHLGGSRGAGVPYWLTSTMRGILYPMMDDCASSAMAGLSFEMAGRTRWQTTSCDPSAYELTVGKGRRQERTEKRQKWTHMNVKAKPSRSSLA